MSVCSAGLARLCFGQANAVGGMGLTALMSLGFLIIPVYQYPMKICFTLRRLQIKKGAVETLCKGIPNKLLYF
jgi:hypothetical protein